jgi:hypothetical protein
MIKKNNKQQSNLEIIEHDFYEIKPYLFGFLALICLYNQNHSGFFLMSGFLFGAASATIFYKRFYARNYR